MRIVDRSHTGWTKACALRSLCWLTACLCCGSAAAAALPLQVTQRITVAGADSVRAIVPGPGGTQVYVASGREIRAYDVASGQLAGTLSLPASVVDMTADAGAGVGYAALASPAKVAVFGLHPLRIRSTITLTDGAPSSLLLDAGAHTLYVESEAAGSLAKFDTTNGRRVAALRLDGALQQMAVDGRGTLYVANMSHAALDAVDTSNMTAIGTIPLQDCKQPTGLAMDPVGRRLFVACTDGGRPVIDTDMGFTFEHLHTDVPGSMRTVFGFHPFGADGWKAGAFSAGNASQLTAIRMNAFINYSTAGTYPLDGTSQALALAPNGRGLWLAVAHTSGKSNSTIGPVELWLLMTAPGAEK